MNEEENDKHEFNFFLDKQIQQKLFEADDDCIAKEALAASSITRKPRVGCALNNLSSNNAQIQGLSSTSTKLNNFTPIPGIHKSSKEFQNFQICGWSSDPSIVYRKTDNDVNNKAKTANQLPNRDGLSSRDSRNRPGISHNFVFRHYSDPRRYIEQYRKEHLCYDTSNSSATKSEFLESRRFYAYNQYSPLAVGSQSSPYQNQNNILPSHHPEYYIQNVDHPQKFEIAHPVAFTNKRDSQKQTIMPNFRSNQQNKYRNNNSNVQKVDSPYSIPSVSDTLEGSERKRSGSAKERSSPAVNGISVQKVATKVNVPNGNRPSVPSSTLEASNITSHFHGYKLGAAGHGRTLDTLACVAATTGPDKQVNMSRRTRVPAPVYPAVPAPVYLAVPRCWAPLPRVYPTVPKFADSPFLQRRLRSVFFA